MQVGMDSKDLRIAEGKHTSQTHFNVHAEAAADISFRTERWNDCMSVGLQNRRESTLPYRASAPKKEPPSLHITPCDLNSTYLHEIIIRSTIMPSQCVRRQSLLFTSWRSDIYNPKRESEH